MDNVRVIGKKCYLRPLEYSDINSEYQSWVNDMTVNKYILASGFPVSLDELKKYYENSKPPKAVIFAVCDIKTNTHFGNARLSQIDWVHRSALYGRIIGKKKYRNKGYGSEALILLLRFGFHHIGLNRIWSAAVVDNDISLASNDAVGMKQEGKLRDFVWANGKFNDAIALSMLRKDFDSKHGSPDEFRKKEFNIISKIKK